MLLYACFPATYLSGQQCRLVTKDTVPIAHSSDVRLPAAW